MRLRPPTFHPPVHFFQSPRSYRPVEGRVDAKHRQRPLPPPATPNRLLAEPGGGPWVNCAWVEVSRGRLFGWTYRPGTELITSAAELTT